MIWHVDIHFLEHKKSKSFNSLIDDHSRYIRLLSCIDSIDKHGKPFAIWSENGSETKEVFHPYLMDNKIVHINTRHTHSVCVRQYTNKTEKLKGFGEQLKHLIPTK